MKRKERWKSGWYQFSSDLDRALGQGIFLAAVLVIAAAIILPGGKDLFVDAEKIAKGLEAGYHTTLFRKGLSGEAVVFLLPLVSTLPYAASWLDERKNGYWKAYMPRTTKEKYAASRITANAVGGGLCSTLGYFLAYLILALIYRPMEAAAETPAISFGALALGGAAVFLMGVFWAGRRAVPAQLPDGYHHFSLSAGRIYSESKRVVGHGTLLGGRQPWSHRFPWRNLPAVDACAVSYTETEVGRMNSIRQILMVTRLHFGRWRRNPRVILSFLLAAVLSFLLTEKVVTFAIEQGCTLQIFEPFVWVFGDGISILLISLILILLFADMPFLDGSVPYYLIRIRVRTWVLGQMLYLILATLIYLIWILGITMLFAAPQSFSGNLWSPTAALLGYSDYSDVLSIPAVMKTFELSRPYACTRAIFLLTLLYALASVMIMYFFNVKKGRLAGIVSVSVFHLFGFLLNSDWLSIVMHLGEKESYRANIVRGWLSPLRQVTYPMHNFGYDSLPTLADTYRIFTAGILILAILVIRGMKRYNFQFIGMDEET